MVPTSPGRELSLPLAAPLAAQLLAILGPVPDQQLTAWPDDLAGSVENLPVVLKGHQVLLFIIPGAVHIPGIEADKGKEKHSDEFPLPEKPFPDHMPHHPLQQSKVHVQLLTDSCGPQALVSLTAPTAPGDLLFSI